MKRVLELVANVIIGARNEAQLRPNLGAIGRNLTPAQVARLDAASAPLPDPLRTREGRNGLVPVASP